jgi:hypothetical protein
MMNKKNPYINNPVASMLFESYNSGILENEKVDALLNKIADNALNTFKILTFDLAPKRDRNPDVMRVKLSDISNSTSVKELTAKLVDYSDDNELSNSKYAEAKRLYLQSLNKFAEALNRASEISKSKDEVILKSFKLAPMKLQSSLDNIAKQAEDEAKIKATSESFEYLGDSINESIFTGYRGRIEKLKKLLTNLISSAEGKNQKNGYGRDWKRTFIDLDEKRKVLDTTRSGFGEKDKKSLDELEKQVNKFQDEFNNVLVQTANRSLQALEDDEEIYTTYSDVGELTNVALDLLTRAKAQYTLADKEIVDDYDAQESTFNKTLFPLKRGDRDSDKKMKGSGLVYAIQNAISNGIPSAGKLIRSKGGPNGIYGPATTSVITTIQKLSGNKNANGEIDKNLLEDIIASDWVSEKDKKAIQKSIDSARIKMNESAFGSFGFVGIDSFMSPINEGKIVINNSEFEKELGNQYKEVKAKTPSGDGSGVKKSANSSGTVKELAKALRQNYSLKVESDDFLKTDGSLKASFSPQFIGAWNKAVNKVEKTKDDYSYFFFSGGVYPIKLSSTSLKNPANWNKWADSRQLKGLGNDDAVDFLSDYLRNWKTFGMVKPDSRWNGIKSVIKVRENSDLASGYEMMETSIQNKGIPFIDFDNLKGDITKAFNMALQKSEKSPDLGVEDFTAVNDFMVMLSNAVSFDGKKFISCIKWIHDHVLGEATSKRIAKDSIYMEKSLSEDEILSYVGSDIKLVKRSSIGTGWGKNLADSKNSPSEDLSGFSPLIYLKDSDSKYKKVLGVNVFYIAADIYPSLKSHIRRMNATNFEQVPQFKPFKCVDVNL